MAYSKTFNTLWPAIWPENQSIPKTVNLEIVEALLQNSELLGIDINAGSHSDDKNGNTILLLACDKPITNQYQLVELLLKYGADPNKNCGWGYNFTEYTALNTAMYHDRYDLVELLLKHGATVNVYAKNSALNKDESDRQAYRTLFAKFGVKI